MRVMITGANGQLGRALQCCLPSTTQVLALGRTDLDISDRSAIYKAISSFSPDLIINAAAYTAVDKAESDVEAAHLTNEIAAGLLASAAQESKARFVHVSTDFVFDGTKGSPYTPDDPVNPLGVYGISKCAGEKAVLAANPGAIIVRTAWVYDAEGSNFVKTMLRLMAERDQVKVVSDQIGTPTSATSLAQAIWGLQSTQATGIHHWTDSGVASWYDFAVAIQEEAIAIGLLDRAVPVLPIATVDFPTPARRPSCSILDKRTTIALIGDPAPHWRTNLRSVIKKIKDYV